MLALMFLSLVSMSVTGTVSRGAKPGHQGSGSEVQSQGGSTSGAIYRPELLKVLVCAVSISELAPSAARTKADSARGHWA